MAAVKVKVLEEFRDSEKDLELRKKDSTFEVEEERAKFLAGCGLVEIVKEEAPAGEKPAEGEEEKPEKRSKKK